MKDQDNYNKWEELVEELGNLEATYWSLLNKLSSTTYKSKLDQMNDRAKLVKIQKRVDYKQAQISKTQWQL